LPSIFKSAEVVEAAGSATTSGWLIDDTAAVLALTACFVCLGMVLAAALCAEITVGMHRSRLVVILRAMDAPAWIDAIHAVAAGSAAGPGHKPVMKRFTL
jgi:hypothetical protein